MTGPTVGDSVHQVPEVRIGDLPCPNDVPVVPTVIMNIQDNLDVVFLSQVHGRLNQANLLRIQHVTELGLQTLPQDRKADQPDTFLTPLLEVSLRRVDIIHPVRTRHYIGRERCARQVKPDQIDCLARRNRRDGSS